jgi:hypothetical protein
MHCVNWKTDVCRDRDIIRSMLQDGKYDMSVEEYAALQMAISQDGFHTPSSTNDDGKGLM